MPCLWINHVIVNLIIYLSNIHNQINPLLLCILVFSYSKANDVTYSSMGIIEGVGICHLNSTSLNG